MTPEKTSLYFSAAAISSAKASMSYSLIFLKGRDMSCKAMATILQSRPGWEGLIKQLHKEAGI